MPGPTFDFTEDGRYRFAKYLGITHWICIVPSFVCLVSALYIQLIIEDKISFIESYNGAVLPGFLVFAGSVGFFSHLIGGKIIFSNRLVEKREKWAKFLLLAVIMTVIIFLLEFIGSIMCYVHVSDLGESFDKGVRSAMRVYHSDIVRKEELDVLQMTYECCGSKSYSEWFGESWMKPEWTKEPNRLNNDVPFSCCNPAVKRPCIRHRIHENGQHYNYDYRSGLTIHKRGCATKLAEFYENSVLSVIGAIILSLSFIQLISSIACRILQTAVMESLDNDDPEGPSQGYIFGKTETKVLDDTLMSEESTEPVNTTEETADDGYDVPLDNTIEDRYIDFGTTQEPRYQTVRADIADEEEHIYNEGDVEEYLAMKFARSFEEHDPPPPPVDEYEEPVYENAPLLREVRSQKGSFMTLNKTGNSHHRHAPSTKARISRYSFPSPISVEQDRPVSYVIDLDPERGKRNFVRKPSPPFSMHCENKSTHDPIRRPRTIPEPSLGEVRWTKPTFDTYKVQPVERKHPRAIYFSSPKKRLFSPIYGSTQSSQRGSPKRSPVSPTVRANRVPFLISPKKRKSRSNSASPERKEFRSGASYGCHHGVVD